MTNIPAYLRVKFGEEVWHDESYDGHPTDFFDRLPAKEQALAILRSPQTQRAIWLIGERRAGKSSLLKLLLEKCRKEKFLAIEVPWQSIHSSDNFYKEFLSQLDGAIGSTSNAPAEPGTSFWDALHERQQKIGQRTLVVGIDEIDSILLEQVDENSRKEILDCLWRLITQELNTKIILTSARPSNRIEHLKASPLVSKSQGIFVQTFPDADLHE